MVDHISDRFAGKTVLITGGANGIGLACAERFEAEGANVAIADLARDAGEAAALRLGARYYAIDVSARRAVDAMVADLLARNGSIDVLINNAGITHACDFLDVSEEDFDRVMRINVKSYFNCAQAVARSMVKGQVRGNIVNMSSINAVVAIPNQVPYTVSKGAVGQLTKVMAVGLAPHGIRVNAIGPGTIATQMARQAVLGSDEAQRRVMSRTPLGRLGEPEEIASVAAFLASSEASYITGQTIFPDGGRLALNYTMPVR